MFGEHTDIKIVLMRSLVFELFYVKVKDSLKLTHNSNQEKLTAVEL